MVPGCLEDQTERGEAEDAVEVHGGIDGGGGGGWEGLKGAFEDLAGEIGHSEEYTGGGAPGGRSSDGRCVVSLFSPYEYSSKQTHETLTHLVIKGSSSNATL